MQIVHQALIYIKSSDFIEAIVRLVVAAIMGGLIGSERGRHGRAAGLRTHILVCIGAAMTSLTSVYLSETLGYTSDIARLSAQVISGIGFLGAGTILIRNNSVITGLTTAAGMWATAAIGVSIGYGFYVGAAVATLICIFSVTVLSRLERSRKYTQSIYFEFSGLDDIEKFLDVLRSKENRLVTYDIIPAKSGISGNAGVITVVNAKEDFNTIKNELEEIDSIVLTAADINN